MRTAGAGKIMNAALDNEERRDVQGVGSEKRRRTRGADEPKACA